MQKSSHDWRPEDPLRVAKQECFAIGIAEGMTQKDAYEAAGYKGGHRANASTIAAKPNIKKRIDYLRRRTAEKVVNTLAVTRGEVVEGLRQNWRSARRGHPVLSKDGRVAQRATGEKDENGEEITEDVFKSDFSTVTRTLEAMGRSIGMFLDVQRVETLDEELGDKTNDELMQFVVSTLEQLDPNLSKILREQLEAKEPDAEDVSAVDHSGAVETLQ